MNLLVPAALEFPALLKGARHHICLNSGYPQRVTPQRVEWDSDCDYAPPEWTDPVVLKAPWAAPPDPSASAPFSSYEGELQIVHGRPLNPRGRTGLAGRGKLGKWGANFAADPIVTRVNSEGFLEMIAIRRQDTGKWAIPGGMVDFGEAVSGTLARELAEEALGKGSSAHQVEQLEERFRRLFASQGQEVYAGYVDDPRNTDHAWMETRAVHLHLEGQEAEIELSAGDDASEARWMVLEAERLGQFYATHGEMISAAVRSWQSRTGRLVQADGRVVTSAAPGPHESSC